MARRRRRRRISVAIHLAAAATATTDPFFFRLLLNPDFPPLTTPLFLPVTAQQAVFLPALFSIRNPEVAEVESLNGEDCRVLTAGLMPELAQATKAEDFKGRIWVASGFFPRRMEVTRRDFSASVDIRDLSNIPSLPASTWLPPADTTDIYHTTPEYLEGLLFVVMNSLKTKEGDSPWLQAK